MATALDPHTPPLLPPASVAEVIAAEGGRVTFARFMEIALTHPTLGYYSRVDRLLRRRGDFSTAPALSPFFNRTVAKLVTELVDAALTTAADATGSVAAPSVVELGGGEGHLAAGILAFWERERPEWRGRVVYRIVEVGCRLRGEQAAALEPFVAAGWQVGWGSELEEACAGTRPLVMVANEFLDTFPVRLVDVGGSGPREAYVQTGVAAEVGATPGAAPAPLLALVWSNLSDAAAGEMDSLFSTADPRRLQAFTSDGVLELSPGLHVLLQQAAALMPSGSLVNIDYGDWFLGLPDPVEADGPSPLPGRGPEGRPRRRRSIRGYFRHQVVGDPLARAGRQDLTADVDFAALDLHGRREGFETILFTASRNFLRAGGAEDELRALAEIATSGATECEVEPPFDALEADRQATVLRNLLDERDLGGSFKLMVQTRE